MVFLLFAVSIVAFALMTASPIDPLKANVGQAALGSMSQDQIAKLEEYWGVGQPPVQRYLAWFRDFVRGDMGISLLYRQKVTTVIAVKLANSLFLMIIAWILSGLIGFLLGVLAGMKRGKPIDKIIKGYCLMISSTPAFWIAMLLLMIFGVWLKILPIGLSVPIGVEASGVTFLDRVRHAILPALTLSITGISNIAMHTREKMIDICDSDYVLFARARGESNWEIFRNHGFRNVLGPAMTLQFASISEIFGGSVLVEQVFSYPVYFANDANAAMMAEDMHEYQDAVYLSLNNTLGGAFCINGKLVAGQNQKAGEFGHMILVPGGKKCYCGKAGCADAYCAASALTDEEQEMTLEQFMEKVEQKNTKTVEKWNQYLDNLAILISNLRMAYDTDIILGGEVGGYLSEYMIPLGEKVMAYNGFEHDVRYLKNCSYKREASAVGAAKHFLSEYIQHL